MIKLSLLAALFGGMLMASGTAKEALAPKVEKEIRDTEIIVEVDRSLESLTKDGIHNVQSTMYHRIKNFVTPNIKYHSSFDTLNNAFVISINSKYIDSVKSLPGVKSVTENKLHFVQHYADPLDDPLNPDPVHDYGGETNASAVTMEKPDNTNDGEGTVIAILDNEFYFRANTATEAAWKHEAFTELGDDVKVRFGKTKLAQSLQLYPYTSYTYIDDVKTVRWKSIIDDAELGYEGSCYFNNKVPFYFDYGGEKTAHGLRYDEFEDFDVSSTISYHGSHVASIAAGNDAHYKGIAPKAQLVCMKVFTNYEANEVDKKLGFQNSTGAYDVPILHALEDCIKLEVDVINMSLGSNLDDFDSDSITMKTLVQLQEAGILSSISAGNSGKEAYSFAGAYGNWTKDIVETGILGGYANNKASTIIASGQPVTKFYQHAFKIGSGDNVDYIEYEDQVKNTAYSYDYKEDEIKELDKCLPSLTNVSWQFVPGFGTAADFKKVDVENKIAAVQRGSISFADKYANAKDAGAVALIIINNDPTASDFNFRCSFGDVKPEIPVVLVLFRDIEFFRSGTQSGTFDVIKDTPGVNPKAMTLSSFTSDGATYDLDLNPDITAPGDNIRGAVPPQNKDDKEHRTYSSYEFLSGTSMSAPNFAGAQSVLVSKMAKDVYSMEDPSSKLADLKKFRMSVPLRFVSTAEPMKDYTQNPELKKDDPDDSEKNRTIASPRRQGAGMANIGRAYNTDVYFEGLDSQNNPTGVAKMPLKNIPENGFNFKFLAHSEAEEAKTYKVKLTVMRTALAEAYDIVPRNYNDCGSVEDITLFPEHTYYTAAYYEQGRAKATANKSQGTAKEGDVYNVTRDIEYWDDPDKCLADFWDVEEGKQASRKFTLKTGRYIYVKTGENTFEWQPLSSQEKREYLSNQDVIIEEKELSNVTITPNGDTTININYVMPADAKEFIKNHFDYGCYVEGYVSFENVANNKDKLNMVYMGFYTGSEKTYDDAPVVEPFGFEKLGDNLSKIYPSELVNDLAKSLLGKDNADLGSTWATTYLEPGADFDSDKILDNSESLTHLAKTSDKYHLAGTDVNGEYYDNPANNIYVGSANHTNTMIIQQFMLRSVSDNFYTIKNVATGKTVRRDVLQDFLFGEQMGKWPLYKSHVDDSYLGGGYMCHRAWSVIPLFDTTTGEMFESGTYEIEFNYILAANGKTVKKAYQFIVDSENPAVDNVYVQGENLRVDITDNNFAEATVGGYPAEIKSDSKGNYVEVPLYQVMISLNSTLVNYQGKRIGRLYIELVDKAFGRIGAIVKFEASDLTGEAKTRELQKYSDQAKAVKDKDGKPVYSETEYKSITSGKYLPNFALYTCASSEEFDGTVDFYKESNVIKYYRVDNRTLVDYSPTEKLIKVFNNPEQPAPAPSKGCGGNIETTSITLTALAAVLGLLTVVALRKRKLGGK